MAVDVFAMGDANDMHEKLLLNNFIYDSIVPDAEAIRFLTANKFAALWRRGVLGQDIQSSENATLNGVGKGSNFLPRRFADCDFPSQLESEFFLQFSKRNSRFVAPFFGNLDIHGIFKAFQ